MSVQDELLTVWARPTGSRIPTRRSPVALQLVPTTGTPPSSRPCGMTPCRCATRSKPSRRHSTAPRRQSRRHRRPSAPSTPVVADHPGGRPAVCPPMQQINWKWVRRGLYATVAALIVLPIVTFGMAYLIVDVPKPGDIRTNQVSTILASDGSELAKIVPPEGNRVDVNIDQIPVHVRDAVMAAEDRDFYSNPGFSFSGFARASKNNIFGGDIQGGSTITQQYVKNALVGIGTSRARRRGPQGQGAGHLDEDVPRMVEGRKCCSPISTSSTSAAAHTASVPRPRPTSTSRSNSSRSPTARCWPRSSSGPRRWTRPSTPKARLNDGTGCSTAWSRSARCRRPTVRHRCFRRPCRPTRPGTRTRRPGPNGLIERQVTKELLELFDISEQTLNTEGLQVTTTIDPKAQEAAEEAVTETLDGQDPDMRPAVVSIDPKTGGVKAYFGGTDAQGFDFAQAGLPTGSSFKVFALVAALQQGIGLGSQVDSSPVEVNGIKITNVEGGGCGTCNIAEALKRSLNTGYYRLMLKLKNGPQDVADAAHQAGIAESFPGVEHTLSEDGKGGPPNNGIVLGQYQSRVIDMASAYATLAESGVYHRPHFVQKVVNADGQVLFDAASEDNSGEQRIDKAVADNVTAAMQPIAAYSNGHNLAGGRAVGGQDGHQPARRHRRQPRRLDGRLHAVAVDGGMGRHDRGHQAAGEHVGMDRCTAPGLPSDIWKARWTARSRAPTTKRSRSRPRSAAMRVCPGAAAAAASRRRRRRRR